MPHTFAGHHTRRAAHRAASLVAIALLTCSQLRAQSSPRIPAAPMVGATHQRAAVAPQPRWHLGSSMFFAANALLSDPPSFYQLHYGFRLTPRDVISLEAITWTYKRPLGIPYGPSFNDDAENYPGSVRSVGVGVAYQRFVWRGAYVAAHALPLLQQYRDTADRTIQRGFQLFTTLRTGYHIPILRTRFFLEPSVAMTAWLINTNVPTAFASREKQWNRYILAEPGLHFGWRF